MHFLKILPGTEAELLLYKLAPKSEKLSKWAILVVEKYLEERINLTQLFRLVVWLVIILYITCQMAVSSGRPGIGIIRILI